MPATYVPIASQTLGSAAATVTFSNIPSTFTDLVVRVSARSNASGEIYDFMTFQVSGDTATNYSYTRLEGSTTAGSASFSNNSNIQVGPIPGPDSTASLFGSAEIVISNYATSANKPISIDNRQEYYDSTNGTWRVNVMAALWRSSSAVSSIVFDALYGNFVAGSSFYLYGIKSS